MACEVGNIEMVNMSFFRATVIRLYIDWVELFESLVQTQLEFKLIDKTEVKSNSKYKKYAKPAQTPSWARFNPPKLQPLIH